MTGMELRCVSGKEIYDDVDDVDDDDDDDDDDDHDCFYITLFPTLEQTHCARM